MKLNMNQIVKVLVRINIVLVIITLSTFIIMSIPTYEIAGLAWSFVLTYGWVYLDKRKQRKNKERFERLDELDKEIKKWT